VVCVLYVSKHVCMLYICIYLRILEISLEKEFVIPHVLYVRMYACMYVCMYVRMYVFIYVFTCPCMHICVSEIRVEKEYAPTHFLSSAFFSKYYPSTKDASTCTPHIHTYNHTYMPEMRLEEKYAITHYERTSKEGLLWRSILLLKTIIYTTHGGD